jgi:hypothetical protein
VDLVRGHTGAAERVEHLEPDPAVAVGDDRVGDEGRREPVVGWHRDRDGLLDRHPGRVGDLEVRHLHLGRDRDRDARRPLRVGDERPEGLEADLRLDPGAALGRHRDLRGAEEWKAQEVDRRLGPRLAPDGDEGELREAGGGGDVDHPVLPGAEPRRLREAPDVDGDPQRPHVGPGRLVDADRDGDRLGLPEHDRPRLEVERGGERDARRERGARGERSRDPEPGDAVRTSLQVVPLGRG